VQDFIAVCARRYPLLEVELWPVLVQGVEAPAQLIAALSGIAQLLGRYDAIVITRGGGSAQDLFCFNDEALVRAVAASLVPVISAIGHEIDTTLCDFVSDLRAPTPSAAAELLTPDIAALQSRAMAAQRKLALLMQRKLEPNWQRLDADRRRLDVQSPTRKLQQMQQRLLRARQALQKHAELATARAQGRLAQAQVRLRTQAPHVRTARLKQQLEQLKSRLQRAPHVRFDSANLRLQNAQQALRTLSPERTLERGYAVVFDAAGKVLSRSQFAQLGERITIRLQDGELTSEVQSKSDVQSKKGNPDTYE
jgi:exodeoxyribonuclease VII large subunit